MSSSSVEKIKEKLDIVEVISAYLKLEKAGTNYKAKCPFHNEKTPSFFVSPNRGSFYCFGCGVKGDMFTFVEEFEGLDFVGALKVLANKAGVELEKENFEAKNERDRLYKILEESTMFFQNRLSENREALEYLKKRGIEEKTIKEWRLGFSLAEWRTLYDYLKNKGYPDEDMVKAGLVKTADKGDKKKVFYDVFRGRIIFPIFDSSGRVVAFSGRILVSDDKSPKYLNSPETVLFNKSEILYGFHIAKTEIRKKDYSIIVEGQVDLVMSQQSGVLNTIATSGTALTEKHLNRLKKISNRIIMSFDSDNAGMNAASKSAELAMLMGMEVKIAELPDGYDPADLIKEDPQKWKEVLKNSKHIIDFYMGKLLNRKLPERKLGQEIKVKILPFVSLLESSIDRSFFISQISKQSGIKEDAILEDLKKVPPREKMFKDIEVAPSESKEKVPRKDFIERRIFGIMFWKKDLEKDIEEKIKKITGEGYFNKKKEEFAPFIDSLIFEAEAYYGDGKGLDRDLEELFLNFEIDYLKEGFEKEMVCLAEAERKR